MDDVLIDYAAPSTDCMAYVTLFYRYRVNLPHFEETERADHAQLRFRLAPRDATYRFPDGRQMAAPAAHIIGATTGATLAWSEGPVEVFGCGLTPEGWAALLGLTASVMRNRVADAVALFGAPVSLAHEALACAADLHAMVAIVERLILTLVLRTDDDVAPFVALVDRWLAGSPSPDLDDLVVATGLSPRHLERKCKALYGAPPKLLARKQRALCAAAAIGARGLSSAEMLDRGFYDQSHMIREVKRFTGLTPGQIANDPRGTIGRPIVPASEG